MDESSIEESTASDQTVTDGRGQDAGYVNLSSIYSLGSDTWTQPAAKNGMPERKLPEKPVPPEKPVSLMMVNGKMDNRYASFGNNSFLYSQLIGGNGARAKDPPSYTAATSGIYDKSPELKSPTKTTNRSPLSSPVNGVNKISDNYERAIAERLSPQKDRSGLFSKVHTGVVSSKVKRSNSRSHDDEDEDYARDSDECSI